MHSCNDCPKRSTCTTICPEVEKLLPPENGRPRADLAPLDREVVWRIQDHEDILLPHQRPVARLYYRFGMSETQIARFLGVKKAAISRKLKRIRQKVSKNVNKTV